MGCTDPPLGATNPELEDTPSRSPCPPESPLRPPIDQRQQQQQQQQQQLSNANRQQFDQASVFSAILSSVRESFSLLFTGSGQARQQSRRRTMIKRSQRPPPKKGSSSSNGDPTKKTSSDEILLATAPPSFFRNKWVTMGNGKGVLCKAKSSKLLNSKNFFLKHKITN